MKAIGFDPGTTTGMAIFDIDADTKDARFETFANLNMVDLIQFTNEFTDPLYLIVCEDYRIFRGKALAHVGSKVDAAQAIGVIRAFAQRTGAKLIMQPVDNKLTGEKLSGAKPKGSHAYSHAVDAYNHLFFRLHSMGMVVSKLEKEKLQ